MACEATQALVNAAQQMLTQAQAQQAAHAAADQALVDQCTALLAGAQAVHQQCLNQQGGGSNPP